MGHEHTPMDDVFITLWSTHDQDFNMQLCFHTGRLAPNIICVAVWTSASIAPLYIHAHCSSYQVLKQVGCAHTPASPPAEHTDVRACRQYSFLPKLTTCGFVLICIHLFCGFGKSPSIHEECVRQEYRRRWMMEEL